MKQLPPATEKLKGQYQTASPFPYLVIDHVFEDYLIDCAAAEVPPPEDSRWHRYDNNREQKLEGPLMGTSLLVGLDLASFQFVSWLRWLTGIAGLVSDKHRYGAGLHQIERGGLLAVHTDFNLHPISGYERRLNVLVFLNRDWHEEWGGQLELWTEKGPEQFINPVGNRMVIFESSDRSFHGHPSPLACPPGMTRKSIAAYFYAPAREGIEPHSTNWLEVEQ